MAVPPVSLFCLFLYDSFLIHSIASRFTANQILSFCVFSSSFSYVFYVLISMPLLCARLRLSINSEFDSVDSQLYVPARVRDSNVLLFQLGFEAGKELLLLKRI